MLLVLFYHISVKNAMPESLSSVIVPLFSAMTLLFYFQLSLPGESLFFIPVQHQWQEHLGEDITIMKVFTVI